MHGNLQQAVIYDSTLRMVLEIDVDQCVVTSH
jgi:hypothetical protein